MKIKFGSITEEINQINSEVYNDPVEERIYINLKDTSRTADEMLNLINENYTGVLTVVYEENSEELFSGYVLDNVRKMFDVMGVQLTIEFVKRDDILENEVVE